MTLRALTIVNEVFDEFDQNDNPFGPNPTVAAVLANMKARMTGRISRECLEQGDSDLKGKTCCFCKDPSVLIGWTWDEYWRIYYARKRGEPDPEPVARQDGRVHRNGGLETPVCAEHICRVSQNNPSGLNPVNCVCDPCTTRRGGYL